MPDPKVSVDLHRQDLRAYRAERQVPCKLGLLCLLGSCPSLHPMAVKTGVKLPASSRARGRLQMELHSRGLEGSLGKTEGLAEVFFCLSCFQVALPSPWSDGHQGRRRCDWCRAHLSNFGKRCGPVNTRYGPLSQKPSKSLHEGSSIVRFAICRTATDQVLWRSTAPSRLHSPRWH